MNKEYSDVNIVSNSYTMATGQLVLLDKYYKVNQKVLPEKAMKELAQLLNNKHEYNIQVTVDYLTIEVEDDTQQIFCHVIIKSLGYSWPQTILYNDCVQAGLPIEMTGTSMPQNGYYITCDSGATVNKSGWNSVLE